MIDVISDYEWGADGEVCLEEEGGVCRGCGCTDEQACAGGCIWVTEDLCSACVRAGIS